MSVSKRSLDVVTCSILAEALERRALLASVASGTALSDFSAPAGRAGAEALTVGDVSYFAHNDGTHGYELWRSDPAAPHGRLVRDINTSAFDNAGRTGSSHPTSFFTVGNTVLFIADDGVSGRELWRTDGTTSGTYRVLESKLGYDGIDTGALPYAPFKDGAIVFTSPDMLYTDGTSGGTRVLARRSDEMFLARGRAYWLDPAQRRSVLAFDGATFAAAFVIPGTGVSGQALAADAQGRLVVSWTALQGGARVPFSQVIATSATVLGRQSVWHPTVGDVPSVARPLGSFGGLALFSALDRGVFATDGTSGALRQILGQSSTVGSLVNVRDRAYFMLDTGPGHRRELWTTTGTAADTRRLAVVDEQDRAGADQSVFVAVGGRLAYVARAGTGWELRAFDPATSSQHSLATVASDTPHVVVSGDRLFFGSYDERANLASFYESDGTSAGTSLVYRRSVVAGAPDVPLNVLGDRFIVAPAPGHTDQVLAPGSVFVVPGPSKATHRLVGGHRAGSLLFLQYEVQLENAPATLELWRTDGTPAGTIKLTDQPRQNFNSFGAFGNLLVFSVNTADDGNEVFRSDGTRNGTYRLRDINASQADSNAVMLATTSKAQFFTADDGVNGRGLWRTDGTVQGTVMLRGFGGRLGAIESINTIGDVLYFVADDGMHGRQLWRSDGAVAGTRMVLPGAATGSAVTGSPLMTGSGALVAPAFTPADGAEIFALETVAPPARPIAPPYVSSAARTLRVFGSQQDDVIRITTRDDADGRGKLIDVIVNGEAYVFDFAAVSVIRIYADAGNDYVEALTDLNTAVQAGAGDDLVITGHGRDTIYGGAGDDALYGGGGTDWLSGDAGNDRLAGGAGRDVIRGGAGTDTFVGTLAYERPDFALEDILR